MSSNKYYEMIESAPASVEPIAHLFSWSENYTFKDAPSRVFLALIGYMEQEFGEKDLEAVPALGYLELDLIGKALTAYAQFGEDAHEWVTLLMEADQEPEDAHLYDSEGEPI
jgi:hypothetical protein